MDPSKSRRVAKTLLAIAVALGVDASAVAAQPFTVTAIAFQAYVIDGEDNPTLTLVRGQTYVFNVNTPGHPFWLKSVQGPTQANAYNNGVTNNGVEVGMLMFAVPLDAPSTLFYNCEFHAPMTGTINITDVLPTATATTIPPAMSTPTQTATPPMLCVGDCAGTQTVAITDIITLVNIALGNAEPSACPHGIPSDAQVNVTLIIQAVNNALKACPAT